MTDPIETTAGAGAVEAADNCVTCGHSSDDHAFSDSYVSSPEPGPIDFGPTHCHALGWNGDCENAVCECPDFAKRCEATTYLNDLYGTLRCEQVAGHGISHSAPSVTPDVRWTP